MGDDEAQHCRVLHPDRFGIGFQFFNPVHREPHERINRLVSTHGMLWLMGLAGFGFAYRREHFLDVERQKAAEALNLAKERFRIAAETSNDLVYEWDLGRNIQWFGDIDGLLGYELNEFPRTLQAFVEALHPEHAEPIMAAVQTHLQQGAPYATEYRIRRKDGTYSWWSARGLAERLADGNPARMVGTITQKGRAGTTAKRGTLQGNL